MFNAINPSKKFAILEKSKYLPMSPSNLTSVQQRELFNLIHNKIPVLVELTENITIHYNTFLHMIFKYAKDNKIPFYHIYPVVNNMCTGNDLNTNYQACYLLSLSESTLNSITPIFKLQAKYKLFAANSSTIETKIRAQEMENNLQTNMKELNEVMNKINNTLLAIRDYNKQFATTIVYDGRYKNICKKCNNELCCGRPCVFEQTGKKSTCSFKN